MLMIWHGISGTDATYATKHPYAMYDCFVLELPAHLSFALT